MVRAATEGARSWFDQAVKSSLDEKVQAPLSMSIMCGFPFRSLITDANTASQSKADPMDMKLGQTTSSNGIFSKNVPTASSPLNSKPQQKLPLKADSDMVTYTVYSNSPARLEACAKVRETIDLLGKCRSSFATKQCLDQIRESTRAADSSIFRDEVAAAGGILAIVKAMRASPGDAQIQAKGCGALHNLTFNSQQNKVAIVVAGGVGTVLAAMQMHRDDAKVQWRGCGALSNLAANSDVNKDVLVRAGCISVILLAMRVHNEAKVQTTGCSALWNICGSTESRHQEAIAAEGGITAILKAQRQYRKDANLQVMALSALKSLALNEHNSISIASAGGIQDVLYAMREHKEKADIQAAGCLVLEGIAAHPKNQKSIAAAVCINDIVEALEGHKNDLKVQESCLRAISNITVCHDKKNTSHELIRNANSLDAILGAMNRNKYHTVVQLHGCRIIASLAENPNRNWINPKRAQAAVDAILVAMYHNKKEARVQELACEALLNLASESSINTELIAKEKGIDAILAAIREHEEEQKVQELGCSLIEAISINPQHHEYLAKAGVIDMILKVLIINQDANIQTKACGILYNIGSVHDNLIVPAEAVIMAVVTVMKKHRQNATVQEYACCALQGVSANSPKNKNLVFSNGGVEAILRAMRQHEGEKDVVAMQQSACFALKTLAMHSKAKEAIVSKGVGISVVLSVMRYHVADVSVCTQGCLVLATVAAKSIKNQAVLIQSGSIDVILEAMRRHVKDKQTQVAGLTALLNLSEDRQNVKALARAGAHPVVKRALQKHSCPEVTSRAVKLLSRLTWRI